MRFWRSHQARKSLPSPPHPTAATLQLQSVDKKEEGRKGSERKGRRKGRGKVSLYFMDLIHAKVSTIIVSECCNWAIAMRGVL
jgi:hypothetical protein